MPAKKAPKQANPKPKQASAANGTAPKAPRKRAPKQAAGKPAAAAPAVEPVDLQTAAYLNYRKRVEQNLPGDEYSDWHDAVRQQQGS